VERLTEHVDAHAHAGAGDAHEIAASILNGTGRPPTKKTWSISSPVLLISTASVPLQRHARHAAQRDGGAQPTCDPPARRRRTALSMIRKVPLPDVALRMLDRSVAEAETDVGRRDSSARMSSACRGCRPGHAPW